MEDITVACAKCGAEIPLSEAVSHRIREQLARDFDAQQRESDAALATREKKLRELQNALERQQRSLQEEVERRLTGQKQQLLAEARGQAREQLALDMKDLEARLAEQKQQLDVARAAELDLRKKQRQLEDQKQSLQLEVARTLDVERGRIREEAQQSASEAERLKLAEKEKLISDMQKQIQALKQKAEQGSGQLQGEVLELDLEEQLRSEFYTDVVEPVAKGARGADVLQRVRTNGGLECGAILWEFKRTKNWGNNWAAKLKEDQRSARAEIAVLVSQALPPEIKSFGQHEGIWVCDSACVLPLAAALRQGLVALAAAHQAQIGKQGKMEELYQYLAGLEFRQRIEALVEGFLALKKDLEDEKRVFTKRWAAREKQLERVIGQTAGLYGSIQGIVGQKLLPEIGVLALEAPGSEPDRSAAEQSEKRKAQIAT